MTQKSNTALLVMDMQTVILDMVPEGKKIIPGVQKAIKMARANNIPVFFIRVCFRAGGPEISPKNKSFSKLKPHLQGEGQNWEALTPELEIMDTDIILNKRRVSAFTGSDLEVVLRGHQIEHIVLTGVATSGVVLSTLREAADKDYQITVIKDCCADNDPTVHQVLTDKVFVAQADVILLQDWTPA